MNNSAPAKALVSVNLNKQPPGCQITHAEVLAAMRTICLMLGWGWLNGAGAQVRSVYVWVARQAPQIWGRDLGISASKSPRSSETCSLAMVGYNLKMRKHEWLRNTSRGAKR